MALYIILVAIATELLVWKKEAVAQDRYAPISATNPQPVSDYGRQHILQHKF